MMAESLEYIFLKLCNPQSMKKNSQCSMTLILSDYIIMGSSLHEMSFPIELIRKITRKWIIKVIKI